MSLQHPCPPPPVPPLHAVLLHSSARISNTLGGTNVADPGCLSWITDPTFFHPGSQIPDRNFSIPDPGSASKNLSILTQKWFLTSRKYDPSCSSRIRILTFYPSRILDPGVKKAPDPGSRSAALGGTGKVGQLLPAALLNL